MLVVLVGGVIAYSGGQILTRHSQVLAVAKNVPVGATITDDDLTVASVTKDPNLSPIPASERSRIVGEVTQVALVKGELLTRGQVGTGSGFAPGQMLVALPLKQGQFPARGLTPGQKVLIVATPGTNGTAPGGSAPNSSGQAATTPPRGLDATVMDVGSLNQATQVTVVDVRVSDADGVSAAQLASTGNLALISLPAGR